VKHPSAKLSPAVETYINILKPFSPMSFRSLLKEHKFYLLGITFFAILMLHPFLVPNVSYHQGDWRLVHQSTPIIMQDALNEYTLPLWTEKISSGIPFFAVPDKGFSYLPMLFMLLFLNPYNALNYLMVLTLIFAGIAMYAFVYYLTEDKPSSYIAAIAWIFNPFF